ncbi:autophagy-related protein 13-like [Xenia sp. Carnegie-2017]|uniref:autophagy-related protein 13-like n=1 Tax=Xenia sp. Carnegie-2017 TaxID=2897299 RepID=UPI001F03699D|nr:autophagy-related protein 13-like [Xenia sp. Carnegie-2017]
MADPAWKLTPQEEKDLNKFQKFFSFKVVQVIVQSRLGEKISAISKPNAMGYDWFNLAITDIHEVLEETKKVMGNNRLPSVDSPLCVEVSLKTNEGNTMVLETWKLGMDRKCEYSNKITFTVYNRMGILLRSLIAVTRVLPAYKIARNQGQDYILCYRIYFGQIKISDFGESYRIVSVGSIATPRGGLTLSVGYRTKLVLPHTNRSTSNDSVMLPGNDENLQLVPNTDSGMQYPVAMTTELRHHIVKEIASAVEDTDLSRSNVSPQTFDTTASSKPSATTEHSSASQTEPERDSSTCNTNIERTRKFSETKGTTEAAFVRDRKHASHEGLVPLSSTPPFASLLVNKSDESGSQHTLTGSTSQSSSKNVGNTESKNDTLVTNLGQNNPEDDFIMVELKAAFASDNSSAGLTRFYRECQNAPPLQLFHQSSAQSVHDVLDTLGNELDVYEQNIKNFDDFIDQLEKKEDQPSVN